MSNKITDQFITDSGGDLASIDTYVDATIRLGKENPDHLKDPEFAADYEDFLAHSAGRQQESSDDGDTMRGLKVSLKQTAPIAKGVVGLVGDTLEKTVGFGSSMRDWGLKGYKDGMAKIAPLQRENDDVTVAWGKAKEGDIGALVDWVQYGLGYVAGQAGEAVVMSAIGSMVGGAVAGAAGGPAAPVTATAGGVAGGAAGLFGKTAVKTAATNLIEKAIAKEALKIAAKGGAELTAEQLAKRATSAEIRKLAAKSVAKEIGSTAALAVNSVGQELGSIYPEAVAKANEDGGELSGSDLARVWATGAVAGAFETISDKLGLDLVKGKFASKMPGGRAASAALGAAGGIATEAGTETAQTILERVGAGQPTSDDEAVKDYINSAAVGALGGGAAGVIGGALNPKVKAAAKVDVAKTEAETSKTETEPAKNIVEDPSQIYKLDENERAAITALAEKEVLGVSSMTPGEREDLFTEIGNLAGNSSDPMGREKYGFYRSEVERLKASQETQGGGNDAGGDDGKVNDDAVIPPAPVPPVSGEQPPPASPAEITKPGELPDRVAKFTINDEAGQPVEIEANLKQVGEVQMSKRDILLKLMDCVQK